MSKEWGDWQIHDGKGCPCVGQFVESESREGVVLQHIAGGYFPSAGVPVALLIDAWDWSDWRWNIFGDGNQVIRYRIRRPRGLTILEELIAEIPSKPKVDT